MQPKYNTPVVLSALILLFGCVPDSTGSEREVAPKADEISPPQAEPKADTEEVALDRTEEAAEAIGEAEEAEEEWPTTWTTTKEDDPMGGWVEISRVYSREPVEFGFPYEGPQYGSLVVRRKQASGKNAKTSLEVMLTIFKGQFVCPYSGCTIKVRFDDGEAQTWKAAEPASHSTTIIFLRKETQFVSALEKAEVVRIEATFYKEGTRIFEFMGRKSVDAESLLPEKPKRDKQQRPRVSPDLKDPFR